MDQKIKNYLGIVGILGMLVASFVAWRYVGAYANSIEPGTYRSFSVSADGKYVAIPDIATFTFRVITEGGKDLGALQTQNTEKTNKVIAFVKAKGVEAKDIKTESYDVQPRYQYSNCGIYTQGNSVCPPPTIVGYTITQSVSVKVRDLGKAGEVLGGVVDSGANDVSQLTFTLDNPDSAKASARSEAMGKAKTKAEAIANEGGFSLGKLISIQIDDGVNRQPVYYAKETSYAMGAGVSASAPTPSIEPGSQDVNVSVTLTYEIN
ncbi:MAG: SIMPL domain-containing protein [Candidatus Liptonbacteria bacterium]|nr:SIMPL domain-containing protein [Candidatus Liptonbacteria bacterium]